MTQVPSRRDRARLATIEEIKRTARQILVGQGPEAVTLRAIAREMGMTAPGLYRYFDSHENLFEHLVADVFTEIADDLQAAIEATAAATGGDLIAELLAACREFRRWSLDHLAEFGLLFGSPLPALTEGGDSHPIIEASAQRFAGVFFGLFFQLWHAGPFQVPAADEIDPGLRAQLIRFAERLGVPAPPGALLVFLRCWMRLYGAVTLEVHGHLNFALDDMTPMFEITLSELAALIGARYPRGETGPAR